MGDGRLERRGARGHGHDLGRAEVLGEPLLEGPALAAGRDPSAAQHPHDGFHVAVTEVRSGEEDLVLIGADRLAVTHR